MNSLKVYDVRVCPGDAAFLIDDGKTAILYDSGFGFTGQKIAENIRSILKSRDLDFMFLTHSHYDHTLASVSISEMYPNAKIVAGRYAAEIFKRPGAKSLMKELDKKVAEKYSITEYEFYGDRLRVDITVDDGDTIIAGDMNFTVLNLPGHTKCSVAFYCEERELLLSCETLGVYNGKGSIIPSVLVGYSCTLESINRVSELKIKNIVAPHIGLLNEEQTAFFLENMLDAAKNAAKLIENSIKAGMSSENIYKLYSETYRDDFTEATYPEDAAKLNTSIMIELIRKEFGL